MRQALALIIALLMCFALPGCSTTKKATTKQETHEQLAATFDQTAKATETGAAFFDQATLEQLIQRYNIVVDFERWDFETPGQEGTPTDSTNQPAAFMPKDRESDKPPNVGRPKSITKGTVTINAEGSQNRATQTAAGALVEKTDSTTTAANVEKKDDQKTETQEQKKASSMPTIYVIILIALGAVLIFSRRR